MFRKFSILAAIFVAVLWALWQISRIESFQLFGTLISEVETDRPIIALTFDDGPSAKFTPEILDILADHNVRSTFFVNGHPLSRQPQIGRRMISDGHELANHAYNHDRMIFMTPWRVAREIEDTDAEIRALGFEGEIHFRPPYGKKLFFLPLYLSRHDRPTIMWSMAPEENVSKEQGPEELTSYILERASSGDIILLHPMFSSGGRTREALPEIIAGLRSAGFELVTLSELLAER